jgi:hypothetical protein
LLANIWVLQDMCTEQAVVTTKVTNMWQAISTAGGTTAPHGTTESPRCNSCVLFTHAVLYTVHNCYSQQQAILAAKNKCMLVHPGVTVVSFLHMLSYIQYIIVTASSRPFWQLNKCMLGHPGETVVCFLHMLSYIQYITVTASLHQPSPTAAGPGYPLPL